MIFIFALLVHTWDYSNASIKKFQHHAYHFFHCLAYNCKSIKKCAPSGNRANHVSKVGYRAPLTHNITEKAVKRKRKMHLLKIVYEAVVLSMSCNRLYSKIYLNMYKNIFLHTYKYARKWKVRIAKLNICCCSCCAINHLPTSSNSQSNAFFQASNRLLMAWCRMCCQLSDFVEVLLLFIEFYFGAATQLLLLFEQTY